MLFFLDYRIIYNGLILDFFYLFIEFFSQVLLINFIIINIFLEFKIMYVQLQFILPNITYI